MAENNDNSIASNVARAIVASLDWSSSADARKAAYAYLNSFEAGDIHILASTAFLLVKRDWSSEIRFHAFKMLQHMVRLRWEELNPADRRNFANVAVELMSEMADPCEEWPLKSQMAALVAEIVRREGVNLWQELLPSLVSLSSKGPVHAELVSMVLRWLPEDITVHNEDLEGDRRRLLLRGLTQSLPEILPLLYTVLERHYGAALSEASRQQLDIAKHHAAAVTATLNAINAYAEWAPLPELAKCGIIHGCGFLLSSPDFRLHACEFFKLVAPRRRPADASTSEYDSAMSSIFQILMNISREFLYGSSSNPGALEESDFEFAEYVCESMVSLGSSNLQCIAGDSAMLALYLEQMLGFFQHFKLPLHYQSMSFWLALMRELVTKPKNPAQSTGDGLAVNNQETGAVQADNEKKKILSFLNDNIYITILDISFQRFLKKEKLLPEAARSLGPLELWSDDFEGKGDFGQYRSRLLDLVRFIASNKPLITGAKVCERISSIIQSLLNSPMPAQDLAVMESMQVGLESVVSTLFDGSSEFAGGSSELHLPLCRMFEGLLQQLLSLKWTEPALVEVLGHYFDAIGPFLKYFPDAVGSVINKLFELLTSLPCVVKDPATSSARYARLQICTSFIRLAKAADKSLLPHMKGIADTMAYLQREGGLLRSEHNILGEAFLVMASSAGVQQQQEVLVWLLEPMSQQWMLIDWQNNYLSEPLGLVRLCSDTTFMWSIFHNVTFFEKALKRSGMKKACANSLTESSTASNPMASHISWMLPPLLKLLRVVHSLRSPSVFQTLPGEIKSAMTMSEAELYSLVGGGNPKLSKGGYTSTDGPQIDGNAESKEVDIRNWLRGIRDSGYNVLGLSTTIGDAFYRCLDIHSLAIALMENIQSMEFRHMRQLAHSVLIPLVKHCPPDLWEVWLEKLLLPLFLFCQKTLSDSWSCLLHNGRAEVPDKHGILAGSDLKVEVMEEKLLRDLTREICALLATMASPGLNTGLPILEHSGHIGRVDMSSIKDLEAFASTSMIGFLLKHRALAVPVLKMSLEAFKWTDNESVTKISAFSTTVVLLAIFTNDVELREYVARDMFKAVIEGLALESNAFISADLVNLCREIYVYLCNRDPAPRKILMALPCITPNDLQAFEEALAKTVSPKEQKQHMKSLLLLATRNNLKALVVQKSVNVITNLSGKPRGSATAPETRIEEGETVGLAAIM